MLYREIIAVCSEIHTKHINTLRGQNVELLNVKLAVRKVTARLYKAVLQPSCGSVQATDDSCRRCTYVQDVTVVRSSPMVRMTL
jgi:hypothetical protein